MWDQHTMGRAVGLATSREPFDPGLPSLLMIHGSGGRSDTFLPQLNLLGKVANPAAIELPGHGQTPGPGMNQVDAYAEWLAKFIELGPIRPVVMGHSLGGAIALTLAIKRPELISGLVIVGSGSRLRVLPAILDGIQNDYQPTVEMIVGMAYSKEANPAYVKAGVETMTHCGPQVLLGDFSACNQYDITAELGRINTPTLLVYGDQDRLTPPKYGEFLKEAITGARMEVIPGAGHMVHLEKPQEFKRVLADFLSGLPKS